MPIIRAYAMPHPPLAVPRVGKGGEQEIAKTLSSFREAAAEIAELAPETIVFITPHNIIYSDYFHISPGDAAAGSLERFNAPDVRFKVGYDLELSTEIALLAEESALPAGFSGQKDPSLDHGVTVPMWFINESYKNYKIVRVSQSGMGVEEHYRLGMLISEAAEKTGRKTVLIASGDLSHKLVKSGPYGYVPEGPKFDGAVTGALESADFMSLLSIPCELREKAAECGYNSYVILAGCFDRRCVKARLFSYEGPFGVGYAVASFEPGEHDESRAFLEKHTIEAVKNAEEKRESEDCYRALARHALEYAVKNGKAAALPENLPDELLSRRAGVFVSLYKNGRLRGCIGTISPMTDSVALEIMHNAVSAGVHDNRFEPVTASELPLLNYKVDVLSPPERISGPHELDVKRYGVIVTKGLRRGLLLPNLDGVDTPRQQLEIAMQKGGISKGEDVTLERFEVVRHE